MSERRLGIAEVREMRIDFLRNFMAEAQRNGWMVRSGIEVRTAMFKRKAVMAYFQGAIKTGVVLGMGGISPRLIDDAFYFRRNQPRVDLVAVAQNELFRLLAVSK